MQTLPQFKKKGLRSTKARRAVLSTLTLKPQTVQEIAQQLEKKKVDIDLVSIYRNLEVLVELGYVHMIEIGDNKKRYELVDEDRHHHHLICTNCSSIKDISIDEDQLLKDAHTKTQFKIDHHHLEFFGLCSNCQHV